VRRQRAFVKTQDKQFSIEIFPPKSTDGKDKLDGICDTLNLLKPAFFSCTYGAGGSTRSTTMSQVVDMLQRGIDTAPHLSFGGDSEDDIVSILEQYKMAGAHRVVALRGDLPAGIDGSKTLVHADYLVGLIRRHFGDHFHIEVAAYPEIHPEAPSYQDDIRFLKGKFEAGANSAITQYFYNVDAYFYFIDECAKQGIEQPIYPGIMPLNNFECIARFSASCGADIPRWVTQKMTSYGNDKASQNAFAVDFACTLCERLLTGGAPGLHFYSMNKVDPVKTIWQRLNLS